MAKRSYTLDSLSAAADESAQHRTGQFSNGGLEWAGGVTFTKALELARDGWTEELPDALAVADSAVMLAEHEHIMDSFNEPVWDVTGAQVDVGAYLAGTPECMIDYPLTETSKVGRIITLVASGTSSSVISASAILRRGQLIVALTLALSRLGHAVELYWNWHGQDRGKPGKDCEVSVRIKGVNDELDPAAIMFAYAHPAMQRRLSFGITERCGKTHMVLEPTQDLYPEGAIFMPALESDRDVPNADEFLRKYLGKLGLLAE